MATTFRAARRTWLAAIIALAAHLTPSPAAAQPESPETYEALLAKAKRVIPQDPVAGLEVADRLTDLAQGDPERAATAIWLQAEALSRSKQHAAALARLGRARNLLPDEPSVIAANLLLAEARANRELAYYAEALAAFNEAYETFGAIEDRPGQARTSISLGILYEEARDYKRALTYFQTALDDAAEDAPMARMAAHNAMGVIHRRMGDWQAGRLDHLRALAIAREYELARHVIESYGNLADLELTAGNLEAARARIEEAMALDEPGTQIWDRGLLSIRAEILTAEGHYDEAGAIVRDLFADLAPEDAPSWDRDVLETAAIYYRTVEDWANAYRYYAAYKALDEAKREVALRSGNALLAADYDYDRTKAQITQARRDAEYAKLAASNAQRTLTGSIIGIVVVVLIAGIAVMAKHNARLAEAARKEEAARSRAEEAADEADTAKEEAIRASAAKSRLLATTSHELRTPLNAIVNYSGLLSENDDLSADVRAMLAIISDQADDLTAIVTDLLDAAKIEAGHFTIQRTSMDLQQSLDTVVGIHHLTANQKDLVLDLEVAEPLGIYEADALRVRQAISNLVKNAIKFTERGTITVTARPLAHPEGFEVAVRDTGIGIAHEDQQRIFEAFTQADDSRVRSVEGTGLGLGVARTVAKEHGGDLTLESARGVGSVFTVTIPARRLAPPEAPVAPSGPQPAPTPPNTPAAAAPPEPTQLPPVVDARRTPRPTPEAVQAPPPPRCAAQPTPGADAPGDPAAPTPSLDKATQRNDGTDRAAPTPAEPAPPKTPKARPGSIFAGIEGALAGVHALTVEDQKLNQTLIGTMMMPTGLTMDFADNGKVAVEMVQARPYDIVLMDQNMPVMDGLTAVETIRALDAPVSRIPIIMVTADMTSDAERAAALAGADGFTGKPIAPKDITRIIQVALAERAMA